MARPDPNVAAHLEWIGFVQPTGLVVSAPALVQAGVVLNRRDAEGPQRLNAWRVGEERDFRSFAGAVLGWRFVPSGYAGTSDAPVPAELEMPRPDTGEIMRPTFAVRTEARDHDAEPAWQLLVVECERGEIERSAHSRLERLLRHTGVTAGALFDGEVLRLVSAPRGESTGWLDFRIANMLQPAGRPRPRPDRLASRLGQNRAASFHALRHEVATYRVAGNTPSRVAGQMAPRPGGPPQQASPAPSIERDLRVRPTAASSPDAPTQRPPVRPPACPAAILHGRVVPPQVALP